MAERSRYQNSSNGPEHPCATISQKGDHSNPKQGRRPKPPGSVADRQQCTWQWLPCQLGYAPH
eukprot:CAMPEP_0183558086 /NCGR_PEP_ID=MMETSP0371-20130417/87509_1 /TAXON_ID=268820 /ORGANISM="Peridinium aciculiferum, Strain PAER-2" /LENGTH=62 /DNA_ID=CAMNT_0025765341 /DNA_START=45 /DNA_END=233 /DNA_ORIENTATION=-